MMIVDKIHKITFASSTSAKTTNEQPSSATSGRATYYGDNVDGGNPAAIVAGEGGVVEAEVEAEAEAVGHATALPPYSAATTGLRTRHHHLSTTQIRTSWDIEHRSHAH